MGFRTGGHSGQCLKRSKELSNLDYSAGVFGTAAAEDLKIYTIDF